MTFFGFCLEARDCLNALPYLFGVILQEIRLQLSPIGVLTLLQLDLDLPLCPLLNVLITRSEGPLPLV